MRASEVLIIGAGPYGLSISTHLRGRGIDHLIVGRPMDAWRSPHAGRHVPEIRALRHGHVVPSEGLRPRGL